MRTLLTALGLCLAVTAPATADTPDSYHQIINVEIKGRLRRIEAQPIIDDWKGHPLVIWQVTAGGKRYELTFATPEVRKRAEALQGRVVLLAGTRIADAIDVTSLKEDDGSYVKETITVRVTGMLRRVVGPIYPEIKPPLGIDQPYRRPVLLSHWELEADGKVYRIVWGNQPQVSSQLHGRKVTIDGTRKDDTITVSRLKAHPNGSVEQTVTVDITGDLYVMVLERFPALSVSRITAGDKTYSLTFANPKLRALAEELAGKRVRLTGTLKDGQVRVTSLTEAPAVTQTVHVKITGILRTDMEIEPKVGPGPHTMEARLRTYWYVEVEGKQYRLDFGGSKHSYWLAGQLVGSEVVVEGTLDNGTVAATGFGSAIRIAELDYAK